MRTPDQIKQEFYKRGITVSNWARRMGYDPSLVHQVLAGRLRCTSGKSHEVAVLLGLKEGSTEGFRDLPFGSREDVASDR